MSSYHDALTGDNHPHKMDGFKDAESDISHHEQIKDDVLTHDGTKQTQLMLSTGRIVTSSHTEINISPLAKPVLEIEAALKDFHEVKEQGSFKKDVSKQDSGSEGPDTPIIERAERISIAAASNGSARSNSPAAETWIEYRRAKEQEEKIQAAASSPPSIPQLDVVLQRLKEMEGQMETMKKEIYELKKKDRSGFWQMSLISADDAKKKFGNKKW